jgi:hypothetical protein
MPRKKKEEASVEVKEEEKKELTPAEYFEYVKSKKNEITLDELDHVYDNCLKLIKKYMVTGQKKACEKLVFFLECLEEEKKVVEAGYKQFVYRWDLDEYIEKVMKDTVCIIELENFEREIPDEVIDKIIDAKEVFANLYVVFSDYTRTESKKIAKERHDKDPIIFGSIEKNNKTLDRLYYIADWEDDFCDLTLEKMVKQYEEKNENKKKPNLVHDFDESMTASEIKEVVEKSFQEEKEKAAAK